MYKKIRLILMLLLCGSATWCLAQTGTPITSSGPFELRDGEYYLAENVDEKIIIAGSVTLDLNGKTLSSSSDGRIISFKLANYSLTIKSTNGRGYIDGGNSTGAPNGRKLTGIYSKVSGCTIQIEGGVTIRNCYGYNSDAGGIHLSTNNILITCPDASIEDEKFIIENCHSKASGAGISAVSADYVDINNTLIQNCSLKKGTNIGSMGGAGIIANNLSHGFTMKNTEIKGCSASVFSDYPTNGGGLMIYDCTTHLNKVTIENCTIDDCSTNAVGGGMYLALVEGEIKITDTEIKNCKTDNASITNTGGAGIAIYGCEGGATLKNVDIYNCDCVNTGNRCLGGGLNVKAFNGKPSNVTMIGGSIKECTGHHQGAGCQVSSSYGGSQSAESYLTLKGVEISNCSTDVGGGGGVCAIDGGRLIMDKDDYGKYTTISNCSASSHAGGAYSTGKNALITIYGGSGYTEIENCEANQSGGGVFALGGGKVTMYENVTISGCKATGASSSASYGGGVACRNGSTIEMTDDTIINCQAANSYYGGGGIACYSQNTETATNRITMTRGLVKGCTAEGNGGGIFCGKYIASSDPVYDEINELHLDGVTIENNWAKKNGGGIYHAGQTCGILTKTCSIVVFIPWLTNLTIRNNGFSGSDVSTSQGGGIYNASGTTLILNSGTTITGNQCSTKGGGIYNAGSATLTGVTINNNGFSDSTVSTSQGGGIFNDSNATLTLNSGTTITGNQCSTSGGGIYNTNDGTLNVACSSQETVTVWNNKSSGHQQNNIYLDKTNAQRKVVTVYGDGSSTYYQGIKGNINIGINVDDSSFDGDIRKIITAENNGVYSQPYLDEFISKVKAGTSKLKCDFNMYQVVYNEPYSGLVSTGSDIYFVKTWDYYASGDTYATFSDASYTPGTISTKQDLAKFMCYVNGLHGFTPHPGATARIAADIQGMNDHLWVPMGLEDICHHYGDYAGTWAYTGTFNGQGYLIKDLKAAGLVDFDKYGLFGETSTNALVQNTFAIGCDLKSTAKATIGCIIGNMNGGTLAYSEGEGTLTCDDENGVLGGLAGAVANNATIHSCMAMPSLNGTTIGGLVGYTDNSKIRIWNCFANPDTYAKGSNPKVGGLVGKYQGSTDNQSGVRNCYVRWGRSHDGSTSTTHYAFVGDNSGDVKNCYAPVDCNNLCGGSGTLENCGHYTAPAPCYTYNYNSQQDLYVSERTNNLITLLNGWVGTTNKWSNWQRTTVGDGFNDGYPTFSFINTIENTVNSPETTPAYTTIGWNGLVLDYGPTATSGKTSIDQVLTRHNAGGILADGSQKLLNLYRNDVANMGTGTGVKVYINENVSLLQSTSDAITAVTCQTLRRPTAEGSDYWHLLSSSLTESPIGFNFGTTEQVPWIDDEVGSTNNNPCNVTLNSDHTQSLFPTDAPVGKIDLFSFDEPYYHWINLKRNKLSHWHMNAHAVNIPYEKDDNLDANGGHLIPAKGYLAAIDKNQLLEAEGTLNNGNVTISVTTSAGFDNTNQGIPAQDGTELKGYNLLGNPYQSYLSFAEFSSVNSGLWKGTPTYVVYDPVNDLYVQGTADTPSSGSEAATGAINMHQGFFIVAGQAATATFTNAMRTNNPVSGTTFRGEERPAYPLINLKATGEDGKSDVAVVEFGRPEFSSAAKMKHIGANGKVYFHHNGEDCALLYLDEGTDNLPMRFETLEDGAYTLTWSTANATFSYLHLLDNMTGMDIDMLTSEGYTFHSATNDYASRFKLVFAYTGVDEESETATEHFAFVSNGNLIVNGTGMLEMIDMNGRVLSATRLTDAQSTVALPKAACGVYVLKLTDNSSSKVQKVVIR